MPILVETGVAKCEVRDTVWHKWPFPALARPLSPNPGPAFYALVLPPRPWSPVFRRGSEISGECSSNLVHRFYDFMPNSARKNPFSPQAHRWKQELHSYGIWASSQGDDGEQKRFTKARSVAVSSPDLPGRFSPRPLIFLI